MSYQAEHSKKTKVLLDFGFTEMKMIDTLEGAISQRRAQGYWSVRGKLLKQSQLDYCEDPGME